MTKPIILRNCRKHGFQDFYEFKVNKCSDNLQYRCVLCKHDYYAKNSYIIKHRNRKNSARNQAVYRKKLKLEIVAAYSPDKSCKLCSQSNINLLCIIQSDTQDTVPPLSYAKLRRNGFPPGFEVQCMTCRSAGHTKIQIV
jgi:hypothetical protein